MVRIMTGWHRWSEDERCLALLLYWYGWSYRRIAEFLGRNHASVGLIVRREDMRLDAAEIAAELVSASRRE